MTLRVGLTGSIGMGKSATARLFAGHGIPVWDADAAVHRLYAPGGPAVPGIAAMCPQAITEAGGVDRAALSEWIAQDPDALGRIEALVHPLVAADREAFVAATDAPIVVLDIPLLFETGGEAGMDRVVVVSAPPEIQAERVLARPGMTPARFEAIRARQVPDAAKRARADHVVETLTPEAAAAQVEAIVAALRKETGHA